MYFIALVEVMPVSPHCVFCFVVPDSMERCGVHSRLTAQRRDVTMVFTSFGRVVLPQTTRHEQLACLYFMPTVPLPAPGQEIRAKL